jgi:hypothetical protein
MRANNTEREGKPTERKKHISQVQGACEVCHKGLTERGASPRDYILRAKTITLDSTQESECNAHGSQTEEKRIGDSDPSDSQNQAIVKRGCEFTVRRIDVYRAIWRGWWGNGNAGPTGIARLVLVRPHDGGTNLMVDCWRGCEPAPSGFIFRGAFVLP